MKKSIELDLTQGKVMYVLLRFMIPILFGNVFQQLYGIADSIVIGQRLGANCLAAVGTSVNISNIVLAIAMGITLGTSVIISKKYGKKEYHNFQTIVDTGIIFVLILSIIITIIGEIYSKEILRCFNIPDEILSDANIYIKIIFLGNIPLFVYNAIANFLRGIGDSNTPLYLLIASSIFNSVLDIIMVCLLDMGVMGAGIATVISQLLVCISCIIYVNKKNVLFKIRIFRVSFSMKILKKSLAISIPATLQQLFMGIGNAVLQTIINGFGTTYISAYTAATKIDGFASMTALNMGKAMPNYIAQNLGAKKKDRVESGIKFSIIFMTIVSIIISFITYFFSKGLIGIFCNEKDVINAGVEYLCIVCLFYLIFAYMQIFNGILLGYGKSLVSLIATLITFCVIQIPLAYFLSKKIGITGVWIAAPVGWCCGLLLRYVYYKKYNK